MNLRLIMIACLTGFSPPSTAQEAPKLANEHVFIARYNGWTQQAFTEYVRELNKELEVGSKLSEAIDKSEQNRFTTTAEAPASGLLVYMVRGLIPAAEQIQYTEVASQDEFEKLVRAQKELFGDLAVVEGSDDKFRLAQINFERIEITDQPNQNTLLDSVNGIPVQEVSNSKSDSAEPRQSDEELPEAHTISIAIGPFGISSSSSDSTGRLVEENGRRFRDNSYTVSTYYRYHEGFMFTGNSDVVWEMDLPSGDVLRDQNDTELNGQLSFYPDRIPMGFRQLAWETLSAAAGSALQQYDDEQTEEYEWRRTSGKALLSFVQAAIFDTQEIAGWMKFAKDGEPVRCELKIAARAKSNLGRDLNEIASADCRFAPILNDSAAATLHLAVKLPDTWKEAGKALRTSYSAEVNGEPDAASQALLDLIHSATGFSEHGTLEAIVKLGWSLESGGVIYGGLHTDDNPELLNSVLTIFRSDQTPDESYDLIENGDLQLLKIVIPADGVPETFRLSHAYIACADSCLWFALGSENAHEIIRSSLDRCRETGGRIQTPILTAVIDFERLQEYPQDDATGLTAISPLCCSIMESVIREYGSFSSESGPAEVESDLTFRALQLGGSKKISLILTADESGLRLNGTLGTALLRSWMAPAIEILEKAAKSNVSLP